MLQTNSGHGGWHNAAAITENLPNAAYTLTVAAPGRPGTLRLRVSVTQGRRHTTSAERTLAIRTSAPATASPTGGAYTIPAGKIQSTPAPGQPGTVTIGGHQALTPGDAVAAGVGPNTPYGFLGKITAVHYAGGQTQITTQPTTLQQVIPAGSFDLTAAQVNTAAVRTTRRGITVTRSAERGGGVSTAATSGGRAIAHTAGLSALAHNLDQNLACNNSEKFNAKASFTLTNTPDLKVSWSPTWTNWTRMTASFTDTLQATATLTGTLSGKASCQLSQTALLPAPVVLGTAVGDVLGVPVVVTFDGDLYLDGSANADGSLTAGITGQAGVTGGIHYDDGNVSLVGPNPFFNITPQGPTLQASASAGLHITPSLQALLYGVAGPEIDATTGLDLKADINANPWWTLTAPFNITARLDAPDLGISTGSISLYSHTYTIATATSGSPSPPQNTPPSGGTFAYTADTALTNQPSDTTFADWQSATGKPVDIGDTLPGDLAPYRCVIALGNQSIGADDQNKLISYLRGGGTLIAVGEHSGGGAGIDYDAADQTLSSLAQAAGANISLDDNSLDTNDQVTTNIAGDPLTAGVSNIGYDWVSSLTVNTPANTLVSLADGSAPLIASQAVGKGNFVMSGDSNVFTDNSSDFFANDGNGQLVKNMCG